MLRKGIDHDIEIAFGHPKCLLPGSIRFPRLAARMLKPGLFEAAGGTDVAVDDGAVRFEGRPVEDSFLPEKIGYSEIEPPRSR